MLEQVSVLWDWLAVSDKPKPCDVLFLFGGAIISTADKGVELYKQGFSRRMVVTGNTGTFGNPEWAEPIADVFAEYASAHGVPKDAIIVQNKSMNTREDVTLTLPILDAMRIPHVSVVLVSRPVHQRRAFATYQKHDPAARIMNVPCHEPSPSQLSQSELLYVATRCMQEYERLKQYATKGDIAAQEIPETVAAAYTSIKAMLAEVGNLT